MNQIMSDQEKRRKLMEKVGDYIAQYLEEKGPVTQDFQPYPLYFEISNTENIGLLKVARDAARDNSLQLRLQLGVFRKGTDRLSSNFLPAADAQEMIRRLRDPAVHMQWLEQVQQLSDSVDDYWN